MCAHYDDSNDWILDSGCTMHATPHKHFFDYLHECDEGEVRLGDYSSLEIKGIGIVPFRMHDNKIRVLQLVRWVPDLKRNLLFESMFDDLHCHIHTHNGIINVTKNGNILIKSVKKNGLYHVMGAPELNALSNSMSACMTMNDTLK